jgi:hypothetical protein
MRVFRTPSGKSVLPIRNLVLATRKAKRGEMKIRQLYLGGVHQLTGIQMKCGPNNEIDFLKECCH